MIAIQPLARNQTRRRAQIATGSIAANVIAPATAMIVIAIGIVGLVGNFAMDERLLSVVPGLATMKVNTGLCLMLCGAALWIVSRSEAVDHPHLVVDIAASSVLFVALATMTEYFFGVNLGIDELFILDPVPHGNASGRMGLNTCFAFALFGISLLWQRRAGTRVAAEIAALLAGLIAITTLVGYLFSAMELTRVASYTPMALHTSIALCVLAIGILCVNPQRDHGIFAFINLSRNVVVPAMLLFALMLGGTFWFWHQLQADIRDTHDLAATPFQLQIVPVLVLFSGVVVSTAIVALLLALLKARDVASASSQLAAVVESSDDAIISKTLGGRIVSWNPGAQRLFGYSANEAIGQSISMVIPTERQHEEETILARIARGEHIDHFETERIAKDGRRLAISATISPIVDSFGRVRGVSKIAHDISERKKFIAALEASNLELERFAYVASHDLQTPLRSIVSFAELLQGSLAGKIDAEAADWLRRVVSSGEQMQSLIQDLLAYARVDSQSQTLQRVDLNTTFDTAKDLLLAIIQQSGARVSRGDLPTVMGDRSQLLQLLQNLIGNALKYRDTEKQESPTVEVSASKVDGNYVICVADNGIGIDSKYHDKIFDLFQRLHSSSRYPGTGIGLAVCRRIAERIGGRIWVESTPGRGSRFYFSVPIASSHE
jgi:PAS domain S-box-containing protein